MRTLGRIVVMGVAGSGKSTIAAALAAHWDIPHIEADSLHSEANVAKMAAGIPLTDADRWPWLAAVRQAMRAERDAVIACSALKRSYRDSLRTAGNVRFLDLRLLKDYLGQMVKMSPLQNYSLEVVEDDQATRVIGAAVAAEQAAARC